MIPKELIYRLSQSQFLNFVETGTQGMLTTELAKKYFKNVHTIELIPHIFFNNISRISAVDNVTTYFKYDNVEMYLGDSPVVLQEIVPKLEGDTVFFLDAHYCDAEPTDAKECPVLNELRIILSSDKKNNSLIIIDDARLFLGCPPYPHKQHDWCNIDAIFSIVKEYNYDGFTTVIDDVILIYPTFAKPIVDAEWKENFHKRYR